MLLQSGIRKFWVNDYIMNITDTKENDPNKHNSQNLKNIKFQNNNFIADNMCIW